MPTHLDMKSVRRSSVLLASVGMIISSGCGGSDADVERVADDAIVGGTATTITAHPWQISLQDTTGFHFCGGSIIAESWVLTAAHCVVDTSAADLRVVAGVTRISRSASGQARAVDRVIVYPGYVTSEDGKDAALLHLVRPLDLSGTSARAIPFATAADANLFRVGVTAVVSGWGTTRSGASSTPDTLRQVSVPIVSLATAASLYRQDLTDDQLPAGTGGKDSCQGDSGGPLTVADASGSGRVLAGVVSWGNGCGDARYPGLYGRVSSFAPWIQGYVQATSTPPATVPSATCTLGSFAAAALPASIPDADPTGLSSTLTVPAAGQVTAVRLSLAIRHTYRGDLVVTLRAPSGAAVLVSDRSGGSADDLVLDGAAVSGLAGGDARGAWTLTVQDLDARDVGTLQSWSLSLCP